MNIIFVAFHYRFTLIPAHTKLESSALHSIFLVLFCERFSLSLFAFINIYAFPISLMFAFDKIAQILYTSFVEFV